MAYSMQKYRGLLDEIKQTESSMSEGSENEMDTNEKESLLDESLGSGDESIDGSTGNIAWADAISRVLNTTSKVPNFILSKAKKDSDIKAKTAKEVEVVDSSGQVIQDKSKKPDKKNKNYSEKRKEMLDKQKKKADWESMCRIKPDITNKEKERELIRIATRGVVHLFNTVEKHQKSVKDPKTKEKKLNVVKGTFMDILKEHAKKDLNLKDDPAVKKVKEEETWSILKDDFMMGAEMKDWDKESDLDT